MICEKEHAVNRSYSLWMHCQVSSPNGRHSRINYQRNWATHNLGGNEVDFDGMREICRETNINDDNVLT